MKIANLLFALGSVIGLAGCLQPPPAYVPGPEPTEVDYMRREDCLYQFICPAIRARGTDPLTLETIGINANATCSGDLQKKLIMHYGPGLGADLADRDRDKTDRHAQTIAMSIAPKCKAQ